MTNLTWTKGNDTYTLHADGIAVAHIVGEANKSWTARWDFGAPIGNYGSIREAKAGTVQVFNSVSAQI